MKIDNKFVRMDDHISLDLGSQGTLFLAVLSIFFLYFGIMCNTLLRDINEGLLWHFTIYFKVYYGLPILILFFTCFLLTYSQDIFHYGIKHSIWLVPVILIISIIWYWVLYGFSFSPFILLFTHWQGYLNIIILFFINITGALTGAWFKVWNEKRKNKAIIKSEK